LTDAAQEALLLFFSTTPSAYKSSGFCSLTLSSWQTAHEDPHAARRAAPERL